MIYEIILNLGTGQVSVKDNDVNRSFTYDYLVITDHTDTPQTILKYAKVNGLPVYGDKSQTGIPLSSISIDRWDQGNMKCVPSSKLPIKDQGSYAAWKYQVTYSQDQQSSGGTSDQYGQQMATNYSASIKQYQQSTNQFYMQSYARPVYDRQYTSRNTIIQNVIGDYLLYETQVKNLIITLDYSIKSSRISYYTSTLIPNYVGSVSKDDITIAGIKMSAGKVRLNSMNVSGAAENDKATVHVQLQIQIQKPVAYQIFPHMSHYCLWKSGGRNIRVRVQRWTASQQEANRVPANLWLDRDKGLGCFSQNAGIRYIRGTHYEYYDQKVILDKNGFYYKLPLDRAPDVDDPNLGKTYVTIAPIKSWKSLDLPKRLK